MRALTLKSLGILITSAIVSGCGYKRPPETSEFAWIHENGRFDTLKVGTYACPSLELAKAVHERGEAPAPTCKLLPAGERQLLGGFTTDGKYHFVHSLEGLWIPSNALTASPRW